MSQLQHCNVSVVSLINFCFAVTEKPADFRRNNYTVSHKETEPTYFCLYLCEKSTDFNAFSLLDLAMNDTRDGINFTHLT